MFAWVARRRRFSKAMWGSAAWQHPVGRMRAPLHKVGLRALINGLIYGPITAVYIVRKSIVLKGLTKPYLAKFTQSPRSRIKAFHSLWRVTDSASTTFRIGTPEATPERSVVPVVACQDSRTILPYMPTTSTGSRSLGVYDKDASK